MKVNELKANAPVDELKVKIVEKGEVREFDKFGKKGRVCNLTGKDDTGEIKITLWNEQIDLIGDGDDIVIKNGFVKEWQGDLQVSAGLKGTIEKA